MGTRETMVDLDELLKGSGEEGATDEDTGDARVVNSDCVELGMVQLFRRSGQFVIKAKGCSAPNILTLTPGEGIYRCRSVNPQNTLDLPVGGPDRRVKLAKEDDPETKKRECGCRKDGFWIDTDGELMFKGHGKGQPVLDDPDDPEDSEVSLET